VKKIKNRIAVFTILVLALVLFAVTADAADLSSQDVLLPVPESVASLESVIYGAPQAGAITERVSAMERHLWGRELPGTLLEREKGLESGIQGLPGVPGLLDRMAIVEWATWTECYPIGCLDARVANAEKAIGGTIREGALGQRIELMLGTLVGGAVGMEDASVSAGTLVPAKLTEPLSVKTAKVGDPLKLALADDLKVGNVLVAPKGSIVEAVVSKVLPPRSFGRKAEVSVQPQGLCALGGNVLGVSIPVKKDEATTENIVAAGTSFAGLVILGPIGLAGGFLVRGNDAVLPAGAVIQMETVTNETLKGWTLPGSLVLPPSPAKEPKS
jgi:uncharacterized membrane protein